VIRDSLAPMSYVLILFLALTTLVVLGHADGYNLLVQNTAAEPGLTERVRMLYPIVSREEVGAAAARILAQDEGWVSEGAYRVLVELHAEDAATMIVARGSFQRGRREILGWKHAADWVFGQLPQQLSDTELALYCYWVGHGQKGWGPDDLLVTRKVVLQRMLDAGFLTETDYHLEVERPLVLRPTPVPIN